MHSYQTFDYLERVLPFFRISVIKGVIVDFLGKPIQDHLVLVAPHHLHGKSRVIQLVFNVDDFVINLRLVGLNYI